MITDPTTEQAAQRLLPGRQWTIHRHIIALRDAGYTYRECGQAYGCSKKWAKAKIQEVANYLRHRGKVPGPT